MSKLLEVFRELELNYGKQNWWPMSGKFTPSEFEICIGAILTQNTNWKNVEKALDNLISANKTSAKSIAGSRVNTLERLIKPSGFYRQKARRIQQFSKFLENFDGNFYNDVTRDQLLELKGIGRETADCILLYACNKPYFVIDAYIRKTFSQLGMISGEEDYEDLRMFFENNLPNDTEMYREFHALIVEHGKRSKVLRA